MSVRQPVFKIIVLPRQYGSPALFSGLRSGALLEAHRHKDDNQSSAPVDSARMLRLGRPAIIGRIAEHQVKRPLVVIWDIVCPREIARPLHLKQALCTADETAPHAQRAAALLPFPLLRHSTSFSSSSQVSGRSLMTKGISCTAKKQHITPESTIDSKTLFGEVISEAGSQRQGGNHQPH